MLKWGMVIDFNIYAWIIVAELVLDYALNMVAD